MFVHTFTWHALSTWWHLSCKTRQSESNVVRHQHSQSADLGSDGANHVQRAPHRRGECELHQVLDRAAARVDDLEHALQQNVECTSANTPVPMTNLS